MLIQWTGYYLNLKMLKAITEEHFMVEVAFEMTPALVKDRIGRNSG